MATKYCVCLGSNLPVVVSFCFQLIAYLLLSHKLLLLAVSMQDREMVQISMFECQLCPQNWRKGIFSFIGKRYEGRSAVWLHYSKYRFYSVINSVEGMAELSRQRWNFRSPPWEGSKVAVDRYEWLLSFRNSVILLIALFSVAEHYFNCSAHNFEIKYTRLDYIRCKVAAGV
jgi:hypothetical protein